MWAVLGTSVVGLALLFASMIFHCRNASGTASGRPHEQSARVSQHADVGCGHGESGGKLVAGRRGDGDDGAMTWLAPEVEREWEPSIGDERSILQGLLEYGRKTLLVKCSGLTGEQMVQRAMPPSSLSLLGLVRHITDVERNWFRRRFAGQEIDSVYARPDRLEAAFEELDASQAEQAIDRLVNEWQAADRAVADLPLDHIFVSDRWGPMSLRWVYGHMNSEYSRHNGHADMLRERIDGRTGM
jgi:uncharacterized damage-inducible protein DinB